MMVGDYYIGRGCRQRGLSQSPFCNGFKVAVFGRDEAIRRGPSRQSAQRSFMDPLRLAISLPLQGHSTIPR